MKTFLSIICLATFCITSNLAAIPAQVMIIRHGEKNSEGNLSEKGLERAGALAPFFNFTSFLTQYGPPAAIFAARPTPNTPPYRPDENTARCIQTIAPTAEALKQSIHAGYAKFQESELANFVMNNRRYEGKNILICWHHETIQNLAMAFGAGAAPLFPNVFDQVWVITYNPTTEFTIYQQELLFGDTP